MNSKSTFAKRPLENRTRLYYLSFLYRTALTDHTPQHIQAVYNWQFIRSLGRSNSAYLVCNFDFEDKHR